MTRLTKVARIAVTSRCRIFAQYNFEQLYLPLVNLYKKHTSDIVPIGVSDSGDPLGFLTADRNITSYRNNIVSYTLGKEGRKEGRKEGGKETHTGLLHAR